MCRWQVEKDLDRCRGMEGLKGGGRNRCIYKAPGIVTSDFCLAVISESRTATASTFDNGGASFGVRVEER